MTNQPTMDPSKLLDYRPAPELLRDRVILVTGAAQGIGRAVALACAAGGATVVLLDKTIKGLEAVYDEIESAGQPQAAIYPMNFEGATVKDYGDLAENIGNELGRLDGIVNNAGWVGALTPFKHFDPDVWARVMSVNLHAPFLLTRACLPLLEQAPDPAIVFSAQACSRAYWGAFGVAKAGLESMLAILADEYDGERFMRVNGVDTGPARTTLRRINYPGEDPNTLPTPERFVGPYLYLLGPDAGRSTGQILRYDLR
ncbi:MAG: SDR family NAD(P)-dependent oxidoreductase [Ectothiorhodospiraceae bacterium]|jgi:NAD(P)-dependent dehydrogenase (short-subunit alcohol dehydrogenase family)|nr:SDR family NAD(P)-dependent oxidoreductase [Ectothiorhodospiraceae bacterium]